MASSEQHYFRISGIPGGWTEHDVMGALKSLPTIIDDDQRPHLSVYPACSDVTQTGLLKLENCFELLKEIKSDNIQLELSVEEKDAIVDIDGHFYDLTPLNTPGNECIADVVAVNGLGGHAFESWTSQNTGKMWLKDFLPDDIKGVRVMSYGYDSRQCDDRIDIDFLDHRRNLLQTLANARRSTPARPLIFIGHGIGGILILQALLQSKQEGGKNHVFNSTRALFFFGVPHQGQYVEFPHERIQDTSRGGQSPRKRGLRQLDECSNFLSTQREDIAHLFGNTSDLEIITFYETKPAPTLLKTLFSGWYRNGDQVKAVKRNSAQLFLPNEHRIPVAQNHLDMVQFALKVDQTYQTVITHMRKCLDKIVEKQKVRELILTKELCECLKSLNESDYESYRDKHLRKRHEGTCSWILSHEDYRFWLENDNFPIVWIHGGPGFGKSVLSAVLSKELRSDQHVSFDQECSVAYFFCDDKDDRLKTSHGLLTNVLAQLLRQNPSALIHFSNEPVYNIDKEKTVWTIGMLWRVFRRIIHDDKLKPMIVIIDALDECEKDTRAAFLDELHDLLIGGQSNPIRKRIKIVITSRPQIPIESYFPDVVKIQLDSHNQDDIDNYVRANVLELKNHNIPIELRDEIQDALIKGSNGMFLWVYLILYDLKYSGRTSTYAIRQKLKTLPKSLPDLYRKILLAIHPDDLEVADSILRWVVWAERPLTLPELAIAMAMQPEHKSVSDLSEIIELDLQNVLRSTLGALITVQDDTVYLVHQSAKEFLKGKNSIGGERFFLQSNESNLHITICCLTYLSFDTFQHSQPLKPATQPSSKGLVDYSFFDYSSSHWSDHMKQLNDGLQQTPLLKSAFLCLAQNERNMRKAWKNFKDSKYVGECQTLTMTTIYGLPNLIKFLFDGWGSLNELNGDRGNALVIASRYSTENVVRYLVEQGADVNANHGYYGNALQAAASNSNHDTVRYLVEQGANINANGHVYGNALQAATFRDNQDTVRYLVEQGADFNANGGVYGNILQIAASNGNQDIVRYLVEQGADVNANGGHYGNALQAAASDGNQDIVRYLVEQGADVNATGGEYGNALQAAASDSNQDTVRYLVEQGADVNANGGYYGNALQAAAYKGNQDTVRYLVEQGADVNANGGEYGNALQAAAFKGNQDTVRYLAEQGADVNVNGGEYGNALQAAAFKGNQDTVRYLVEQGANVNPMGGNLLTAAAENRIIVDYLKGKGAR